MISSSTNLSSHVRAHTSRVHRSQVMIKRPQPAPCVVCGSQSCTCQPAVRRSTNIIEPSCELKMHPCILCAAKFRPWKELDNHNRAEHFGAYLRGVGENKFILLQPEPVLPRQDDPQVFFCVFNMTFLKPSLNAMTIEFCFKTWKNTH